MDIHADLHLHTVVSDGTNTPEEMLLAARDLGLTRLSFTDHDAVGAFRHFTPDLIGHARSLGIELTTGIELDSDYLGREIHLLGYGIDPAAPGLNEYLDYTQGLRRQRVTEQIEGINGHFRRQVVDPAKVFLPNRDTLMKPHLVHAMLDQGLFPEYREAARWLSDHIRAKTFVPKLEVADAIRLIVAAGGQPVLAHPGYLVREAKLDLEAMLDLLIPAGLVGIEVWYRYFQTGPAFPDRESERSMIAILEETASRRHLLATRGSDAHDLAAMAAFSAPPVDGRP